MAHGDSSPSPMPFVTSNCIIIVIIPIPPWTTTLHNHRKQQFMRVFGASLCTMERVFLQCCVCCVGCTVVNVWLQLGLPVLPVCLRASMQAKCPLDAESAPCTEHIAQLLYLLPPPDRVCALWPVRLSVSNAISCLPDSPSFGPLLPLNATCHSCSLYLSQVALDWGWQRVFSCLIHFPSRSFFVAADAGGGVWLLGGVSCCALAVILHSWLSSSELAPFLSPLPPESVFLG